MKYLTILCVGVGCAGPPAAAPLDIPADCPVPEEDGMRETVDGPPAPLARVAPSPDVQAQLASARALRCAMREALNHVEGVSAVADHTCDTGLRLQGIQQ